jgi:FkbM family methyltransferase
MNSDSRQAADPERGEARGGRRAAVLIYSAEIAAIRAAVAVLRVLGLRDRVYQWRLDRRRSLRTRAEQAGSDRLSQPALHSMDRQLDAIIGREGGYFVEAGANDGFRQSNTYWLERFRGWSGLLVEPMPELAREATKSRPSSTVVQFALVPFGGPSSLRLRFADLMSAPEGTYETKWTRGLGWIDSYVCDVAARPLSSILDELDPPEIDLLSLDVEGHEPAVLQGIDFDRHAPRYILIEMNDRVASQPLVAGILGERYVEHSWLSPNDALYVRTDVNQISTPGT